MAYGRTCIQREAAVADRPRVLVADDDIAIRILISRILERNGFDVDLVPDGAEAIGKILQNDYAVIVLDLMMPRLDGFSVANFLKERRPDLLERIIVTTAFAATDAEKIQPLIECRVDKPFDIATLAEKAIAIATRPTAQAAASHKRA
jgi:two-component system, OmpR family, response regulator MprA